ncbi:protein FAR1-RELATED SEQUENCE 5-like [Silene latifolia]|uniref:protein FAR1-RELATED SEQUENCE 5-like n=1 Tax=Silene latifolia TaxID=37657 RepID=UPI003D7842B8
MDMHSSTDIEVDVHDLHGKRFHTREELFEDVKSCFVSKGYAISIKNSKKDEYVTIGCDRGGVYRSKSKNPLESLKKETSTRLINCPFKIQGKRKSDGLWTLDLIDISHNHDPSKDMAGHPSCRRLTKSETSEVERLSIAGIQPRNILSSLRLKNPNIQAVSRTLYNVKTKIRNEKLDGRSMIQALFEEFGRSKFLYNYKSDEKGHLTHVFLAHPKSVMLSKLYRKVYVLDCTYKTNVYKMPLLDVIGVSSSNKSFYSCFVFLKKEKVEDYIWALQMFREMIDSSFEPMVIVSDNDKALTKAISIVFPRTTHLLCIWHIQKNIVAKCKKQFIEDEDWDMFMSTWNAVMYAETESSFEESWVLLELLYKEKKSVILYLNETWMPHKQKFVSAWSDTHPHLGNRASSRAEGAHAKLKGYLQVSTGDFAQVVSKICLAIENEFQEINTMLESERIRVPHRCRISQFKFLLNCVSHFALGHLFKQYEMAKFGTLKPNCSGHFTATMGLPCAHLMNQAKESSLVLDSIDPQWRIDTTFLSTLDVKVQNEDDGISGLCSKLLDKYELVSMDEKKEIEEKLMLMLHASEPILLEPDIQTPKGRPPGALNKRKEPIRSTKRRPSEFEIVETSMTRTSKQKSTHLSDETQSVFGVSDSLELNQGSQLFGIDLNSYISPLDPFSLDSL